MIIRGELVNPPTSISCFRDLTFFAHTFCKYHVLLEATPKDPYYKFLKRRGAMDFIDDILDPGEETGLRVDTDFTYAPTACIVEAVHVNNLNYILKSIGFTGINPHG